MKVAWSGNETRIPQDESPYGDWGWVDVTVRKEAEDVLLFLDWCDSVGVLLRPDEARELAALLIATANAS
jgi:hypothetical protein